jgi:hypothetical protein
MDKRFLAEQLRKLGDDFRAAKPTGGDKVSIACYRIRISALTDRADFLFSRARAVLPVLPDTFAAAMERFQRNAPMVCDWAAGQLEAGESPADARTDLEHIVNAISGDTGSAIITIANDAKLSTEQKMARIYAVDRGAVGWSSDRWADVLGVTPGRIRQTEWWKDRKRLARKG